MINIMGNQRQTSGVLNKTPSKLMRKKKGYEHLALFETLSEKGPA